MSNIYNIDDVAILPSPVSSSQWTGLIPAAGRVFGSSQEAYEYLVRSIRRFTPVGSYATLLGESGYEAARIVSLDFGLCCAVAARKP